MNNSFKELLTYNVETNNAIAVMLDDLADVEYVVVNAPEDSNVYKVIY